MLLNRLEDLALFAEVVEHCGFSAAARHLGVQRSKLSRRIVELEQRMGVRLLQRNTRQVSLTLAGEQVYFHARAMAHEAREAFTVAAEANGEPRGLLRVSCSSTFAAHALVPVVSDFHREYPNLRIAISTADHYSDLIRDRADLTFRVSSAALEDSSLVLRAIGAIPMILAVNPRLLEDRSGLKHPREIPKLGLLALASQDGDASLEFSCRGEDRYLLKHLPQLICNNMTVLHSAVAAGLGAAVLPRYLCGDDVGNGHIVSALDSESGWKPEDSFVYTLIPARIGVPLMTRLFLEFATPRLEVILSGAGNATHLPT